MLYNALNNNLTFKDNMASTVGEVVVRVDSTGKPQGAVSFKLANTQPVIGTFVINVSDLTEPNAFPIGGVTISYTTSNNNLLITNITGLKAGNQYRLRIIALN